MATPPPSTEESTNGGQWRTVVPTSPTPSNGSGSGDVSIRLVTTPIFDLSLSPSRTSETTPHSGAAESLFGSAIDDVSFLCSETATEAAAAKTTASVSVATERAADDDWDVEMPNHPAFAVAGDDGSAADSDAAMVVPPSPIKVESPRHEISFGLPEEKRASDESRLAGVDVGTSGDEGGETEGVMSILDHLSQSRAGMEDVEFGTAGPIETIAGDDSMDDVDIGYDPDLGGDLFIALDSQPSSQHVIDDGDVSFGGEGDGRSGGGDGDGDDDDGTVELEIRLEAVAPAQTPPPRRLLEAPPAEGTLLWAAGKVLSELSMRTEDGAEIVGRDGEMDFIRSRLDCCSFVGVPGNFYISGPPGSGKTSIVTKIVNEAVESQPEEWTSVFVDCIRLARYTPVDMARLICRRLKISGGNETKLLNRLCDDTLPRVILVIDEADALFTRERRKVLFAVYSWQLVPRSRCVIISVANATRLPAALWTKMRSRIGIWHTNFGPYSVANLEAIAMSRIARVARHAEVLPREGVGRIANLLGSTSGDARRMLAYCRAVISTAVEGCSVGSADIGPEPRAPLVTDGIVIRVMAESLQSDPKAQGIANLPPHMAILLAAAWRACQVSGVVLEDEERGGTWAELGLVIDNAMRSVKEATAVGEGSPASWRDYLWCVEALEESGLLRSTARKPQRQAKNTRGTHAGEPKHLLRVQLAVDKDTLMQYTTDPTAKRLLCC